MLLACGNACRGGRRASGAGVAEKKIAILEQALRHHPGSDELLLALLGTVEVVLSGDDVEERWRRVLARHGGSARLWQAFLSWQRARFGTFSCSAMRVSYGDALIVCSYIHLRSSTLKSVVFQSVFW